MTLSRSWRFSSDASLAAAVLLCVAALFSWNLFDVPAIQTTAGSAQIAHGANGHPQKASYPTGPAQEAEDGARGPVNADLMTALLLVFSFGVSAGWSPATGREREAFRSSGVARRSWFVVGQDPPFLGVLRL